MNVYPGNFRNPAALRSAQASVTDSVIPSVETLRSMANFSSSMRGVRDYSATAEGYVKIPADGIYEFSTLNTQLYLDGRPVVDNSDVFVLRSTPHNAQVALKAGLHEIRVVFVGGFFDGWPTYWNAGTVSMRPEDGKWAKIDSSMLFH